MISKSLMEKFEKLCKENNITGKKKQELLDKLKQRIKKSIYEPGEAIGIVAAQSISEPATQMSLDYNESIILKKNDYVKIVRIGEFIDNIVSLGTNIDGWDVFDVSEYGIFAPTINEEEKIEWKKVTACSRHKAPKTLLKIKTLSGRTITATDSHSFVTRRGNRIVPVSGKELKTGDRIPALKFLPENCLQTIEVSTVINNNRIKTARKPLPSRLELDALLGWMFGAYLAEGNATKNYISISNTNAEFLSIVRKFADKFGFTYNEYDNPRGFAMGHDIRINSTLLSAFLKKLCGTGANKKKVPDLAYSANEEFVSGLLRGYFDGDGNVSVSRSMIRASSSSEQLIDGISLLLTRFGIFSTKLKNKKFCIAIPYKYAKIFKDRIGFTISHKKEGLEAICKKNKQDYIDMIGGFGDILFNAAKKLGYPTRYVNNFTKKQKIGRSTLAKYVRIFEKLSMKKDIDIEKELSIMKRMLNSDVVWDEITHISHIKPSSEYVYDITVEGTETFTTFDGIITHNTMRSYTLASQSDRLSKVTQGLPRLIEIFDARKTFEKNMTIYLKPKFNTREGAKAVANKIKSTKLKDKLVSDSIDLMNTRIELELSDESDRDIIKTKIEKQFKKCDVTYRGKKLYVTPHDTETKNLRKIRNKLLDMHISGVKHIEEIIVVKEGDDWILQTSGSNLKKVLEMEEVDIKRTTTNDIYQVYEILGIEAARNVILREAKETLDEQGLDVDIRHLIILADTMTANGKISAIGRYGVSGRKVSVLARANFEETKKHIVNASFYGENDTLDGIIENVMIGQITPVGTGMVDLIVDVEKMKKSGKK